MRTCVRRSFRGASRAIALTLLLFVEALSGAASHVETAQQEKLIDMKQTAQLAITRWEKDTGVEVKEDARSLIQTGFSENQKILWTAFEKQGLDKSKQSELGRWVVEDYMYNLRDVKHDPLTVQDIQARPVSRFLVDLQQVLHGDMGRLEVISNPDVAKIAIDGKRQGLTCRKFVVTAGDHEVSVVKEEDKLDCREKISVPAGETVYFRCPSDAKCPEKGN